MIDEGDFIRAADGTLAAIGSALDDAAASTDADVDWTLNDGVLEIDCGPKGKLIVNRHVPNREVWVAARAGGFHFAAKGGRWRDTRSGDDLAVALARLIKAQAEIDIALPMLRAPA